MYGKSSGSSKESGSPVNTCHDHGDTNTAWATTQPAARAPQRGCSTNPSLPQRPSNRGVSGCWAQNAPKTEPGPVPVTVTAQTAALHKARPAPQRPVPGATTALPHQRGLSRAPRGNGSPGTDPGRCRRLRGCHGRPGRPLLAAPPSPRSRGPARQHRPQPPPCERRRSRNRHPRRNGKRDDRSARWERRRAARAHHGGGWRRMLRGGGVAAMAAARPCLAGERRAGGRER